MKWQLPICELGNSDESVQTIRLCSYYKSGCTRWDNFLHIATVQFHWLDGFVRIRIQCNHTQEFNAHESNVNCLALGHMSGRVLVTGGYDRKVNLWAIGKCTYILSLNAHQSPVECVKFGHTEEFVCSGSQAGELNIWDLEANKKVRTFSGHRDAIKSLDFHPYGDFLASGSLDTTIKLWDLRRKGCLSSYKGHTLTVNKVRFSPDGIWVASAGEDGTVKLWDVRVGRRLAELTKHEAAVLTVEFHPHEFLLASGSMDRTVQFWDLENFSTVSSTKQDSGPIRCLKFSPEGHCLYAGVENQLKVFVWEPGRLLDSVNTGWGNVQDMVPNSNQLIGASFHKSKVTLMTVDMKSVRTKAEPVLPSVGHSFPARSANVRKSFSKEKLLPGSFTVKRMNDDSERSGGDTEEEKLDSIKGFIPHRSLNRTPPPVPEISPEPEPAIERDGNLITRHDIPISEHEPLSLSSLDSNPRGGGYIKEYPPYETHSPSYSPEESNYPVKPVSYTPQPAAFLSQPSGSSTPRSPSPKQQLKTRRHSTSDQRRPILPDKPKNITSRLVPSKPSNSDAENGFPLKMNNIRHSPSEPILAKTSNTGNVTARSRKGSLTGHSDTPLSSRQATNSVNSVPRPVHPVRPSPAPSPAYLQPQQNIRKVESPIQDAEDRLGSINLDDFLPKSGGHGSPFESNIGNTASELEAMDSLASKHNSMMMMLNARQRNLQLVFSIWHNKDAKAAIDSAAGTRDQSVMADLLAVLVLRPAIWNLDICGSVLPSIEELIQSKYEAYMTIGCTTVSLILRSFAHTIKSNILAPIHTVGVDISREERYNKSMRCYQQLISIRAFLLKRQTMGGKLGQSFRELLMLMENLEN